MPAQGIVAAGHPHTVEAARMVLREGGNAFDAALAALCAACVVEPVLASLGGGGFLLAWDGHRALVYDFFVHTPRRRRPVQALDFYPIVADFGGTHQTFHIGLGSIATPGVVRGLFEAHRDLGSIPMRRLVEPAVGLARQGFLVNALHAYIYRVVGPIYSCSPDTLEVYGSPVRPGELIGEGEVMRQPVLADALEILAREGDRLFYEGEMGSALVRDCATGGGYLSAEDLREYRVVRRTPLDLRYRAARLLTNPPPSCGGILIAFALKLLEGSGLEGMAHGSAAHLRLLARVMDQTNKARIDARLRDLAPDRQAQVLLDPSLISRYRDQVLGRPSTQRGTTHISVIDARGRAASLTVSNGEGSGYLLPHAGIMLNNMLGEEDINPHGFHRWPVNSRIASMMSPTMLQWPDGRLVATGSGGSNRIRTALLQVLVNLVDFGMDIETAVHHPRAHFENGFLDVEGGFERATSEALAREYPRHRVWEALNLFFGGAHSVECGPGGRALRGAGDPRRGGVWALA